MLVTAVSRAEVRWETYMRCLIAVFVQEMKGKNYHKSVKMYESFVDISILCS